MIKPSASAMPPDTSTSESEGWSATHRTVPRRRRVLAWMVDYLLAVTVMVSLAVVGIIELTHSLPAFVGAVASDAGWNALKLVAHGGHGLSGEVGEAAAHEWFTLVAPLLAALTAAVLFQFIYQAVMLSWRGCTFGKIAAGARVRQHETGARLTARQAMTRALITTGSETGLLAVACILLTLGHFLLSVVVWVIAVAAFWTNALVATRGRNRTLADRIAGTTVVCTKARPGPATASVLIANSPAVRDLVPAALQPIPGSAAITTPPHSHRAPAAQRPQTLGVAGLTRARRLAQKAHALGSTGAELTQQIGQQAVAAVADRSRQAGPRTQESTEEDLASQVEQRVRRGWEARRQQTTPPSTEHRSASLLGLDPDPHPQPSHSESMPPETGSTSGDHHGRSADPD